MELKEQILRAMDKNSKLTPTDLAMMFDTTPETVTELIEQLEKDAVICGYPTLINWDKTDSEKVMALIEVKVTPQRGLGFDKIAERIYKFEEVESVYLMSGGFDLTVRARRCVKYLVLYQANLHRWRQFLVQQHILY